MGTFRAGIRQHERRNPESLRYLLFELLKSQYHGDLKAAAGDLERAKLQRKARSLRIHFTDNVLYEILYDRIHIKFAHLDGFAQKLGIPTAVILLYSRLIANQRDHASADSVAILRAFIHFCEAALERIEDTAAMSKDYQLGYSDFEQWIRFFQNVDQLDLFDGHSIVTRTN